MNTNVPPQTNPAYESGRPATTEYQEGYGHQQNPYANEMQEKQPLHHVAQGEAYQGTQFQDTQDPNGLHSERDAAGYRANKDPNVNAFESEQHHIPPNQTSMSLQSEQATTGHGAEPVPASYQQDAYGNQHQQDPRPNEMPEKPPVHPSRRGEHVQGTQFNQPAGATGFHPEQDHAFAGNDRNVADGQQMPPNYDGHPGAAYQDQRYPDESAHAGGPAANQGQHGNFATDTGLHGNRDTSTAGNYAGDQYGQHRTTAGNTGTASWRTDPAGTFNSYLSHPSVSTTVNQMFSGGPFATSNQTSMEPTSREARHLKTSGKMEEMVGKMIGSENLQRRGQEKVVMGRNMAVQVQDLKQAGKLEGKATKLRAKAPGHGGGRMTEEYAGAPPAEQMGPSAQGGPAFQKGF